MPIRVDGERQQQGPQGRGAGGLEYRPAATAVGSAVLRTSNSTTAARLIDNVPSHHRAANEHGATLDLGGWQLTSMLHALLAARLWKEHSTGGAFLSAGARHALSLPMRHT